MIISNKINEVKMATIQDNNELFKIIITKFHNEYGTNLESITVYGSSIGPDFNPKISDINLAIVLNTMDIDSLLKAKHAILSLKKKKVGTPLFLTKEYIQHSLDTFPIEFLNIQTQHKTIFGEDIFSELTFSNDDLRLQAERELKGKSLLLRLSFLENIKNHNALLQLISSSITSFIPVFKALLFIKAKPIPNTKESIIRSTQEAMNIDGKIFHNALDIKYKRIKLKKDELLDFFRKYSKEVDKLSVIVDNM
ncbi:MAG: hypothetical protein DRH57_07450 [Candidatus Cloacimonadota bacterium]|nr:MAG: hypothetical protein DRH57_07450 [Candidatus Cloacimonadota bacterium]